MNLKQTLLFVIFLTINLSFSSSLAACCVGQPLTLTEIMGTQDRNLAVFLCTVDSTYIGSSGGARSYATVTELFRGENVPKQVILATGGNTTAGGQHLKIGQQYLIFSQSRNNLLYGAFVCDNFSKAITDSRRYSYSTKEYLEFVRQYFKWQKERYSGNVKLILNKKLQATGAFKNGKLHGEWKHFAQKSYRDTVRMVSSQLHYKNGEKHGKCLYFKKQTRSCSYYETFSSGVLTEKEIFMELEEINYLYQRIIYDGAMEFITNFHADGEVKEQYAQSTFEMPTYFGIKSHPQKTGNYYINLRDETPITKGTYLNNRKVGKWTYYDEKTVTETMEYFEKDISNEYDYTVYFQDEGKQLEGNLENGKRHGIWIIYNKEGEITVTVEYKNGVLDGTYCQFYEGKKSAIFYYQNGEKQPEFQRYSRKTGKLSSEAIKERNRILQKHYYPNGQLRSIESTENEEKHGWHLQFSESGDTLSIKQFVRGYQNGFYMKKETRSRNKGKEVGQYRKGYKVGDWKNYDETGKLISITHYQTEDSKELIAQYFSEHQTFFDKNEQEISAEEYWKRKKAEHMKRKLESGK